MNWLQIALRLVIIATAIYLFMQKEINLQVQFHSPIPQEQPDEQHREQGSNSPAGQTLSGQVPEGSSGWRALSASLFGVGGKAKTKQPSLSVPSLQGVSEHDVQAFIERFSHVAMSEMRKYGIPASVILANGLLQSEAGKSASALATNNYFHIPCGASWQGGMVDRAGVCYRKYESAWAGFRGHSEYLGQQWPQLLAAGTDYREWAKGLEASNVWRQSGLSKELIRIIEQYDLQAFDE